MKMPKVGECVYAFQFNYGERIGELEFLTSTQEHATGSLKLLNKEIKSADTERRESCDVVYFYGSEPLCRKHLSGNF